MEGVSGRGSRTGEAEAAAGRRAGRRAGTVAWTVTEEEGRAGEAEGSAGPVPCTPWRA